MHGGMLDNKQNDEWTNITCRGLLLLSNINSVCNLGVQSVNTGVCTQLSQGMSSSDSTTLGL